MDNEAWYTVMVLGNVVEASTTNLDEAEENLRLANIEYEGAAEIWITDNPIAW